VEFLRGTSVFSHLLEQVVVSVVVKDLRFEDKDKDKDDNSERVISV